MKPKAPGHVYGPVFSRRLGRSLGLDLVPFKTCTYDCIYCQLGRTTDKTVSRREHADLDAVAAELERKLASGPAPDHVSLAGSGEPTLHAGIGRLVRRVKKITRVPVAVLTNGSLLSREDVREDLMAADLVLPSLDAGDEEFFRQVNRPHPAISLDSVVEGLEKFSARFPGEIRLEVLLLDGLTATVPAVEEIAALVERIRPRRVQLNTASRPPCEERALRVPLECLERLGRLFPGGRR